MIDNDMKHSEDTPSARLDGDTPNLRLFALLEAVAQKSQPFTLQTMVEETGLPKPTMHRMLAQLEGAGILQRDGNGRHYGTGQRLMRLAQNVLLNNTTHGARHAVLTQLVRELGESCNITAFSGSEVLYLDRVETPAPLRFYLHPGSRVPAHCSATGKLFLSQMSPAQRRRLLANVPLEAFTGNTLTTFEALEQELDQVRTQGYAFDNEEFLPGLLCLGVLVPAPNGNSNMGLAVQAPIMRFSKEKALSFLPKLQAAVEAIARINDDVPPETDDD
ncbi:MULTISPECIES: IclR family transcriptional regulator [Comamonas]|uniref:Acetate operon repressor n=1 Tax=Comamonas testosteroni TaxID=285 RepID=A0A8B4S864_COMTE|nr:MULTISPECIES: IclR family transcriptional regulator [Comamonas]EHN67345.1 transcriptional regulator, IclR family protein [Comamonas testosteroni ATCC 11996]KKI12527.1 IclR family transcriptional regulator [Comamonas thiooxydans]QQN72004.1 IclR family transcriptional regulator [Comamonas testosteroni]SUY79312.1 Acetate operon repressor [Comamonas testosteroni]